MKLMKSDTRDCYSNKSIESVPPNTGFGKGEGDGLPRKVALGSQLGLPQNVQRRGNCATLLTVVIK